MSRTFIAIISIRSTAIPKKRPEPEVAKKRLRLLVDTNIVLDVILARSPWLPDAAALLAEIERETTEGYVAAHAITTVYYIVAKAKGREVAAMATSDVLRLLTVVPTDAADFQRALSMSLSDFEDAVQAACAQKIGADFVITRNAVDYHGAPISVRSAGEVLPIVRSASP